MRRGRKLGGLQNPRDERGWMIPRDGTIRRRVYDAMVEGLTRHDLGLTVRKWDAHRTYIVNWQRAQAIRNAGAAL